MGAVAATFKIMPENPADISRIKKEVEEKVSVKEIREVPIAFGIKLLEVLLIFDDKEGIGTVEDKIRSIKGVASVESGDVTLL